MNNKIINKIKKDGFCIVKNIISIKQCDYLKKSVQKLSQNLKKNKHFKEEAADSGQMIIRDLVLRDPKSFLRIIDIKKIQFILEKIFKDQFILDNCMASNSVKIKKKKKNLVHIDSHLPIKEFHSTTDVVVLICLDNFFQENGSTKVWPGSHLSGLRAQNVKISKNKLKKFKHINAQKGSIVFFLGHLWHQIGRNRNAEDRWGILCHYKRWWIKPATDFTKCGKQIFNMLSENQKKIFGFNSISPKYNFKKQIRPLKTLRKISLKKLKYNQILNY